MDSLTNYLPSMWKIRELKDKVTNVLYNFTDVEVKVREATNDEAWGPHGSAMTEIAQYTFTYEHYTEVMGMLWKRMFQEKENWRATYKSLLLLNYLLKNGSEKVVTSSREHLYDIRSLETFSFCDENGKDQGVNIRVKAKEIAEFVQDDDRLREERKKAKKNKDKYVGINSSGTGSSGGFSSMSSSKSSYSDSFSGRNSSSNWSSSKTDDFTDSNKNDWKSNNNSSSTIQDRISNITSKVKNIIGDDKNDGYGDGDDNDEHDQNETYNELGFENKKSSKSDSKMASNNKKETKKVTPKIDDTDDFGDFVTHRIESKATNPKIASKPPQPNIDDLLGGFDNLNIQPLTTTIKPITNDIDQLFSFDNPTPTTTTTSNNDFDFFGGLMTTTIPTSATLPNLSSNKNSDFSQFADFNKVSMTPTTSLAKQQQQQPNKSNTMWDALGTSVDINLDSLSPHSKGSKVTNTNVPMNSLKSQSQSPANLFNFAAAPLSPLSKNSMGMK